MNISTTISHGKQSSEQAGRDRANRAGEKRRRCWIELDYEACFVMYRY